MKQNSIIILFLFSASLVAQDFNKVDMLVDKKLHTDGPNCWNAALVTSGVLPSIRASRESEFKFYLSSPLCGEIQFSHRQVGDIGRIALENTQDGSIIDLHAFMYWNNNHQVFHKPNSYSSSKYEVVDELNVIHSYLDTPKTEWSQWGIDKLQNNHYELSVTVYRCNDIDSYFKNNDISSYYNKMLNRLNHVEEVIERRTLNNFRISSKQVRKIQEELIKIRNSLLHDKKGSDHSEEFAKNILLNRISSLHWQFMQNFVFSLDMGLAEDLWGK